MRPVLPRPTTHSDSPRAGYRAYLLGVGVVGWGLLCAGALGLGPDAASPELASFAIFFGIIVAARVMAFRIVPDTVLSLDSAFYVAAAMCLGPLPAGFLVGGALTLDPVLRMLLGRARGPHGPREPGSIAYVFYFGGMTGALLWGLGWLFGVDGVFLAAGHGEWVVVATVLGLGVALLVAHYALQGVRIGLRGASVRRYLRHMALPAMLSEASLLPLAMVVVFIYEPTAPLGFALLGVTYLLINFVFNRLSRSRAELRKRVGELETLNATARRLASSLQLHELVDAVARETVSAIPEAELLTLAHASGGEGAGFAIDCFDRERDSFERIHVGPGEGATAWVVQNRRSLAIPDIRESEHAVRGAAGVRSWMGVPIVMYGAVEGVLAIQSRTPHAFTDEHLRLLESLGVQTAVSLQNAHLYELAMVDGLTGLFVRRYFDARLDEEIERARRYETEFSVVMMDLDNFKDLNDTHGHTVGDQVLRAVSEVVRKQMRGVDTAARYGGEEIAMILPRTDMVSAYNQAERIRSLIGELRVAGDGEAIAVTASFGIASFPESKAKNAEDLVRKADRALYRAKKTGKDRVELYWADEQSRPTLRSI